MELHFKTQLHNTHTLRYFVSTSNWQSTVFPQSTGNMDLEVYCPGCSSHTEEDSSSMNPAGTRIQHQGKKHVNKICHRINNILFHFVMRNNGKAFDDIEFLLTFIFVFIPFKLC